MATYIMLTLGENAWVCHDEETALGECQEHVFQNINDFHRHNLPLTVTPEVARGFDLRLIKLTDEGVEEVKLPFQEWADQYVVELERYRQEDEDREYKRYLELKAKYEGV